jgi:5-methylcytosine-specific restriction endonuclease McrA
MNMKGHTRLRSMTLTPLLLHSYSDRDQLQNTNDVAPPSASSVKLDTRSMTSLPTRKRKKTTVKKSKKKMDKTYSNKVIDDDELADHVSHLYLHGPGGLYYKKNMEESTTSADTTVNLDKYPCLVLNADYQPLSCLPLSLWSWQDSIKAVFSDKATVVDVYQDVQVRAAHFSMPLPSVLALQEYVTPPRPQTPAFTKRNVFLRDEYRCQYCQQRFATRDLSLDHVVPRCHGGSLHWENAVTSCRHCNGRKGSLLLQDLPNVGMRLHRLPRVPSPYELAAIAGKLLPRRHMLHAAWEPYLPQYTPKDETFHDSFPTTMAAQFLSS